jgi:ribonuclease HII
MSPQPDLAEERRLWALGYDWVAGIDEAGRGAWAGPVVAAAVVFPACWVCVPDDLALVRDSKLLSPRQRDRCYDAILERALAYGLGWASAQTIDAEGIVPATRRAMLQATLALCLPPQHLLIDALRLDALALPQRPIIKGDLTCLSIAAASILAKVTRDRWMIELHGCYPAYGFDAHKGYGTERHRLALAEQGPCAEHRCSYEPIRVLLAERDD